MTTINFTKRQVLINFVSVFSIVLILLGASVKSFANQGDSTHYLTLKDTLFITLNDDTGEKIFDHKIQKGQNLYALARFYGLNEEELYPYNPNLKSNKVGIGQVIHVPIPNAAIKRFKGDNFKRWKYAPIMFIVKKKDNLYKIAKTLFHMPIDSVVKWNNLPDETIQPGQVLHVGWMSIEGVNDTIRSMRKGTVDIRGKLLQNDFAKVKSKSKEQKGAAFWQKNGNQHTDLYCLHRTAKAGSSLAITNNMNNKTVYAKVIGKIPDNAYNNETVVIVAPSVAKLLGAKDEKFFVKVRFVE